MGEAELLKVLHEDDVVLMIHSTFKDGFPLWTVYPSEPGQLLLEDSTAPGIRYHVKVTEVHPFSADAGERVNGSRL